MKPIPPNAEWQIPFLDCLADGQTHTRAEILDNVTKRLGLSDEQCQARLKNGMRTVINRMAWMDVNFCKAGWTIKQTSRDGNLADVFQLTAVGLHELKHNRYRINEAYVKTFWK